MDFLKGGIRKISLAVLRLSAAYRKAKHLPKGKISLRQLNNVVISGPEQQRTVKRIPPLTLDKNIYWKFEQLLTNVPAETFLISANNWRVWGNQGAVITDQDDLFTDVSREFEKPNHSIFNQFKLVPPTRLKGNSVVISASGGDMYYHWLFDLLPRVKILKDYASNVHIDHYIINYRGIPFQKEALNKLGIDIANISSANDHFDYHVVADHLLVPSLPSQLDIVSSKACNFIIETFLDRKKTSPFGKKIYLQRNEKRKITNADEIENFLTDQGFKTVLCEDYSIAEQAAIFHNADIVIGPHGAAFSNVVFCKPGTRVIEFFSPRWINPCYWTICNERSLNHYYLIGEGGPPDERSDAKGTNADIELDLKKLRQFFNHFSIN